MRGWLVNDWRSCIPGSRTLWDLLLERIEGLEDRTGAPYSILPDRVEAQAACFPPDYIIRNAGYFRRLNIDRPTLSFVQDILEGPWRDELISVCSSSRVVFNSDYTRSKYPELHGSVIPIGVETGLFKWEGLGNDGVLFIGSTHPIKGFKLLVELANKMPDTKFVAVLKTGWAFSIPQNLELRRPMPQEDLAGLMRSCALGLCLSEQETQHLAGIEMGLCGLPLVTTNVGVYYGLNPGPWGEVVQSSHLDSWEAAIRSRIGTGSSQIAELWKVYDEDRCASRWEQEIESCFRTSDEP